MLLSGFDQSRWNLESLKLEILEDRGLLRFVRGRGEIRGCYIGGLRGGKEQGIVFAWMNLCLREFN